MTFMDAEEVLLPSDSASVLKTCIDCGFPFPLAAFYTSTSSIDGRQPRCKGCDRRRKEISGQTLRAKAAAIARKNLEEREQFEDGEDYETGVFEKSKAREKSETASLVKSILYAYEGVKDGYLIYGYVR